jgi:signal transduction histidine kinase
MQIYISKIWERYAKYCVYHYTSSEVNTEDGLPYLRDKLFISILLIFLPMGILMCIPSVIVAISTQQYIIAIFDTLALLVLMFIFFRKNYRIQTKKILFLINLYVLAIFFIVSMGTQGPGAVLLVLISVLTTLLHGKKPGLISVFLNAVIYSLAILSSIFTLIDPIFHDDQTDLVRIIIAVNIVSFNIILVLSVSFLIDQLNQSFQKEKKLQTLLKAESLDLMVAKLKAEESDRLKSAFLANMSHEVRTPLNSIIGFSELLADPDFGEQEKHKFIQQIVTNGNNLLTIISDIMDISKMESGEITIRKNQINTQKFISGIRSQFVFQAEEKNLELKLVFPDTDEKPMIFADVDRLTQVFNNLIGNALKFTETGSIEMGYQTNLKMVKFFVRDTGIGIPTASQNIIFERFRQLEDAKNRKYGGNGLGLSIAKNLVELMAGKIWVESEAGKGAAFYFTLPTHNSESVSVQWKIAM